MSARKPKFEVDASGRIDLGAEPIDAGENPCRICGRTTKAGTRTHVRLDVDGYAVTVDTVLDPADDLGCFPVGPECVRRLPAAFVHDLDPDRFN